MTKRLQWCLRIMVVVALVSACALSGKPVLGAVNLPTIDTEFLARAGSSPSPQDVIVRMQGLPLVGRVQDAGAEGWLDTVAAHASEAEISQEQNVFLLSLAAQGVRYTIKQRLSVTFNGLALNVAGYDLAAVAGTNHVSFVYESQQVQVLDDDTNAAMGVDQALWNRTSAGGQKLDGTGTTIGIIDTGIDYMHPDLGGAKFPNAKVVGGYDFADKDSDPIDIQGHGTHVAGIAAADGKVQGVAPKAKLYAYKVFSDQGGGAADGDIIAALDRSVRNRCTVVNLSLGTSGGTADTPENESINNAVKAGVVVVAATGNSGPRNPETNWPLGSPATALNAIAVAASNDGPYPVVEVVTPTGTGLDNIMGSYADIAPAFKEGSMYSIVDAGYGSKADFAAVNVTGKVALVERGPVGTSGIYFRDKVLNAQAAGAAGVIIYNHSPGVISMTLRVAAGDETRNYIPCIGITQDAGLDLKMLTTRGLVVRFGTRSDLGTLADFSSMGPTEDFHFKPEVSAPGVTVNSTFLGGEYARLDGTSMASPGVAGAVALIKAAHPDWTPQTVKLALMNTSNVLRNWQNGEVITWTLQGAGRVDVPAAIDTPAVAAIATSDGTTTFQTGTVLVDDDSIATATTITIRSLSDHSVTFSPSFGWTMDARAGVEVTVVPSSVVVAPGGTAQVSVTTTVNPATVKDGPHEGMITLQSISGILHVPYIFWRASVKVPEQLSEMQTSTATLAAPGGTMDVQFNIGYGGVRPAVEAGEGPQGSSFASEVVAAVTGIDGATTFGTVYRRSLLLVGDHGFTWDGRDVHGNLFLTDGDYLLRTSVLESNNDPANLQISEVAHQSAPIHVTGMAGVPVLSLNIVGGNLRVGQDVTVSLSADTTTSIAGIAAAVQFEPWYLSVKSVQEGDFLNQGGTTPSSFASTVDALVGSVAVKGATGTAQVQGHGNVCTITFTVLHDGSTELWLGKPLATNSSGTVETIAQSLAVTLRSGANVWDIDGNKRVDLGDMVILARAYGSKIGDKGYDNAADLNGDGRVDDADLQILRQHYGVVYP
jgi:minor extracellular serine protease Vpr